MTATGYEPLNTLKPVADNLWLVDGPAVVVYGFPFSTRATVVRLQNGDLWVHSPTELTANLKAELDALGPVRHLVAPNQIHFLSIPEWQAAYPDAVFWSAPGVRSRAEKKGIELPPDQPLQTDRADAPWDGQIKQLVVRGSKWHHEAVFHHDDSETLILTDLIESFETHRLPARCRPFVWLNGIDDTDGKTPPIIRWSYRDKVAFAEDVETMISWGPRRVILAHGRWYERDGVGELERAFRKLLRVGRWEAALNDIKAKEEERNHR